jgi:hypothetical protein
MLPRTCSGVLYEALELDSQCTEAEITQQYRRLALRYHPDRNGGTTVAQFQLIEEAHRVLRDPQQRQLYDTVGRHGLKQLGDYSSGVVGGLLLAIGNVAAGCLLAGIFSTAFFFSLLMGCYKIDAPSHWPSWGVILIPIWLFLPLLVLASVAVMVASVKRGLYVLLLPSVRLLLCVVIVATTAAALDHRLSATSAFIPWIAWYVLGTISDVVMMVPTVYRRTHTPQFTTDDAAAATSNSTRDPFLAGGPLHPTTAGSGSGVDGEPSPSSAASTGSHSNNPNRSSDNNGGAFFVRAPWRTRQYWREFAELILEAVCVYSFLALAFHRALQQRQRLPVTEPFISFWIIFAPLFVFFGVHLVVNAWEGFMAPSSVSENGSAPSSPFVAAENHPDAQQQRQHQRHPSMGERVASVSIRCFPAACGLYMSAMWAAKAEHEYNKVSSGADPSAFVAFLPFLVVLGSLSFFVCCGGCLIMCLGGSLLAAGAEERGATPQSSPSSQPVHLPAPRSNSRSSPNLTREEGYRSTATRTPRAPSGPAKAATSPPTRRGNAAKDVAIEQID